MTTGMHIELVHEDPDGEPGWNEYIGVESFETDTEELILRLHGPDDAEPFEVSLAALEQIVAKVNAWEAIL